MPDVFMGQIMMTGFPFAPRYFAACNGAMLSISQNPALFSLLGTQFGGDGMTTFALPDLRGRTPVGAGGSVDSAWQAAAYGLGEAGGVEAVTLQLSEVPAHTHSARGSAAPATGRNPSNALYATVDTAIYAAPSAGTVTLANASVAAAGGGQPHGNMQPYETVNFVIAINGLYPPRS